MFKQLDVYESLDCRLPVTTNEHDMIEHSDGASSELIREMKEVDDDAIGPRLKRRSEEVTPSPSGVH